MHITLSSEILFHIGSFPVTNSFVWLVFLTISLIAVVFLFSRSMKEVPGRAQGLLEVLVDGGFGFIESVIGSKAKAKKVFPLVFTLFVFILLANLFTYVPGQSAITLETAGGPVPLFRAVMADYGQVFLMTIITVFSVQIIAIVVHGPFGYLGKFFNFSGVFKFLRNLFKGKMNIGDLFQGLLDLFLGVMDIVGELAKVVSLSFRLFGNMFAGEVLTSVMLFLAPFFVPLPFMLLGLLTAVVQAFVFSILTLIFISMASEIEEDPLAEQVTP